MRFAKALDADHCSGDPELLPDRLVRAAVVGLSVDGAALSLSLDGDLRTPLAASGDGAATAERLEFTTGCGPCLAAAGSGLPLLATEALVAHRWPIFHDLFVTRTAFRSVLALPLPGRLRGLGAMDLYFREPGGAGLDVVEGRYLAGLVAGQLEAGIDRSTGKGRGALPWLARPAARRRSRLWTAVGMVIAALSVSAADALALLRGHAYATDRTVEDLADDVLERRITPGVLRGHVQRPPTVPTARPRTARAAGGRPIRRPRREVGNLMDGASPDGSAWDGHVLLLHSSEQERRAGLAAWVRRGLERGEKVVYTELADGPGEPLSAVLEGGGVDVASAVRDGQLVVLPVARCSPSEGPRVVVERALAEGFPAVRLSADARAAPPASPGAYRESERRMDELVGTRPVSVMCQDARPTTNAAWLEDAVAAHLTGVRQATLATGGTGDGLILRGEVDTANADVFTAVLAAGHATSRDLHLDLSGVSYLDAGAGRRLADATCQFRAAGGQVLLVAPQPPVERTLALLNLGDLPGIQLLGGQP